MEGDDEVIDLTVKSSVNRDKADSADYIQQDALPLDAIVFESIHTPVNEELSVISNTQPSTPVVTPSKEKEEIIVADKPDVEAKFIALPDFDSELQQIELLREVLQSVYSGILREGIRKGTEYPYIPDNLNRENTDALKHKLMTGILRLYEESRGVSVKERTSSSDRISPLTKGVTSSAPVVVAVPRADTRSTDWVEDKEEVPPPPFGLESAVIDHMLKTWTSDEHKVGMRSYFTYLVLSH